MLRSMSAFKIKASKKKRNDFTKHEPTKPSTTVHLPGPAAEKEKGWVRRHDANYDTDYYENVKDGRVTWTPQREDSTLASLGENSPGGRNPSSASATPPPAAAAPPVQERKTPQTYKPMKFKKQQTQVALRPQPSMAVLGGEVSNPNFSSFREVHNSKFDSQGSLVSFENTNPMRASAVNFNTSFDQEKDLRRSESWDLGLSFDSSAPGDIEMANMKKERKEEKKRKKKKKKKRLKKDGSAYFFSLDWGLAKCLRIYLTR
ncbi:hypothetical protein TrVE_jg11424 [Triparma verrucosa]|uniref:WW domain-containing protein n=1 Tax=Triparma verrucosa TaxID=1606542 RepID=A0A9W7FB80_9STRA|nr:hypothetical protein TrVE_jg11424 [Triparma verrucosa]